MAREQPLWDVRALWFYPPTVAKLDPHRPFLDLFILKGLGSDFTEVRILKEFGDLRALSRVNPLVNVSGL